MLLTEVAVSESRGIEGRNRCGLSSRLAEELGKEEDDHVRVESTRSKAYFIVDEVHDGRPDVKMGEEGLERVGAESGEQVAVNATVPVESREEAFITGDIAETLWDREGAEVFISCPHGGDIEYNTDEMGMYLFKKLRSQEIESSAWMLHGYYSGDSKDAFERWHVKKPVRAFDAYPGLRQLIERDASFRYGVGFHIHEYDYVAVGGMADQEIRKMVADSIRGPVPSKYDIVTDYGEMDLTGRGTTMSHNYFAEDNQGVQIEMPYKVAYNKFHSVPEAVADVFTEIL
ncbi:hypothetical protein [Haloplanus natans]|uniref:hypothetical protein n=1 Tax=Haloplanus natans TaxID=376171 RepID=UPI0006775C34|nr:hypothetical protein [Haloplanus natans]